MELEEIHKSVSKEYNHGELWVKFLLGLVSANVFSVAPRGRVCVIGKPLKCLNVR